jgi:hypothetical protein
LSASRNSGTELGRADPEAAIPSKDGGFSVFAIAHMSKRSVILLITHNSVAVLWRFGLKSVTFNFGVSLLDCVYGDAR